MNRPLHEAWELSLAVCDKLGLNQASISDGIPPSEADLDGDTHEYRRAQRLAAGAALALWRAVRRDELTSIREARGFAPRG